MAPSVLRAYSRANRAAKIAGSRLVGINLGNDVSTAVDLNATGASDDDKIANIVRLANDGVDFPLAQPTAQSCQCMFMAFVLRLKSTVVSGISGEWEKIAGRPDRERRCVPRNVRRATKSDRAGASKQGIGCRQWNERFAEIGATGKVNPSPRWENHYDRSLAGLSSDERSMPSAKH